MAGEPLDEVATHAFPASRRRRYERLAHFPRGLVVLGDAISSFNPIYGQGISIAALEAVALRQSLQAGRNGLSKGYFKASGKIVNIAWDLAIGSDLSLPEVDGERPILTRLSNAWADRILKVAEHDPYVAEVFGSIFTDLIAPPTALIGPRFVWRVARNKHRASAIEARLTRPRPSPRRGSRGMSPPGVRKMPSELASAPFRRRLAHTR